MRTVKILMTVVSFMVFLPWLGSFYVYLESRMAATTNTFPTSMHNPLTNGKSAKNTTESPQIDQPRSFLDVLKTNIPANKPAQLIEEEKQLDELPIDELVLTPCC